MTDNLPTTTETQRPKPPSVTVGGNVGALIPQDIEQAFRIAQALAHSGMTPNGFQTPEKCFVAIMAGAELGLPPFQSLQSFAIINNRPTLWGDALMAIVRTHGFKVREWYEGEGDALTAFCEITRPDNGDTAEASFSVEDAKTAGLWKKAGPWTTNPKRMQKMRARAFAIRDGAADVLRGFSIREEVEDYGEALPVETPTKGTGLLGKLEATQTLATEGFGIRDLNAEAGEPAPAAEPKKRERKKSAATEALERAGEEIAEEAAAAMIEALAEVDAGTSETVAIEPVQNAPDEPQDAQVEPEAATEPEASQAAPEPIDGPAPAGVRYFLADKPAFPSGRRVVYVDVQSEKEAIDDTPEIPTYTAHPVAPELPENPVIEPEKPATTEEQDGAEPRTALDAFLDTVATARDAAELVAALRELFADPDHKTPEAKRRPRQVVWETVAGWNADGAGVDPVSDPFLLACYIETETDPDAVEQTLPLARDQEWFKAGGEPMQAGVARAINDRVKVLRS